MFADLKASKADRPLFTSRDVVVTVDAIHFGVSVVPLADVSSYRVDTKVEEGERLGNIIMVNLFVGATLAFLVGILATYLTSRFYLAVVLFGLLSASALDDLVRARGLKLYRLLLQRPKGEVLAYVTPDRHRIEAVTTALDRAFAVAP